MCDLDVFVRIAVTDFFVDRTVYGCVTECATDVLTVHTYGCLRIAGGRPVDMGLYGERIVCQT